MSRGKDDSGCECAMKKGTAPLPPTKQDSIKNSIESSQMYQTTLNNADSKKDLLKFTTESTFQAWISVVASVQKPKKNRLKIYNINCLISRYDVFDKKMFSFLPKLKIY
jgi:hypothetical protein